MQERVTYEANAEFLRETVRRLEAGDVTIDELEGLTSEMAKAMSFCQDRLTRTRQSVAETMRPQATQSIQPPEGVSTGRRTGPPPRHEESEDAF